MTSRPECRSQPETGSWVGVKDVKHDASGLSRNTIRFLSDDQSQQKKGRRLVHEGEERRLACAPAERVLGKVVGAASVVPEVRVEAAFRGCVLPRLEAQVPARPTKHMRGPVVRTGQTVRQGVRCRRLTTCRPCV